MSQRHARTRARRYSRREHEVKQRPTPSIIWCLKCGTPMADRGSEYCDECELRHGGI